MSSAGIRGGITTIAAVALVGAAAVPLAGGAQRAGSSDDGLHLVVVPDSPAAEGTLARSDARVIARYDAFTLVEANADDTGRLVDAGADRRDDMRTVRIGTRTGDPSVGRPSLLDKTGAARRSAGKGAGGLAVVQYVGPIKESWSAAVAKSGARAVSYMAQNAQLVFGDESALEAVGRLAGEKRFIRAVTPFTATDKLLPGLPQDGRADVVVTTVAGEPGAAARADLARLSDRRADDVQVAGLVQRRVSVDAARIASLAALSGVVAVERWVEPELLDERAARIVAGQIDASFRPVLGNGHLNFLGSRGFTSASNVQVDITDTGVDKGVVPVPGGSHPDFYQLGNPASPSRILYAHEDSASDPDARDCGGHGTNVASIAAGYNAASVAAAQDAQGFNYGLGVSPYSRIGVTKIFRCAGGFDVTTSLTTLHSGAWAGGARISNNSWGAPVGGAYDAQAREFDALVRDARPTVAGNQPLTEVVAAGNSGFGGNTIGSPGTAKNVITVGASESVRAIGAADGCGVTDPEADSARDIVDFSSRGPTDDGRTKPDIVAPGTHVTGARPQSAPYDGSGTCNPSFPAGSTLYTLVSGTSQATPEATGFAALLSDWYRRTKGGGTKLPSPAMTKALMANTATDLAGGNDGAGSKSPNVPDHTQGWGRINLARLLDPTVRQTVDQTHILGATGVALNRMYAIDSSARPLRVTLAWTDAPGPTFGSSFVNDLDLEVTAGGVVYKGNVLSGGRSVTGGFFDSRNNLENVFLPAGVTGPVRVRIVGRSIAGNGVPGNADATDQDYALVVSNAGPQVRSTAVLADAGRTVTIAGDGDTVLERSEPFTVRQRIRNVGNAAAAAFTGTMTAPASDAAVTAASSSWPALTVGASAFNNSPNFGATVASKVVCGDLVDLTITAASGAVQIPVSLRTGQAGTAQITADSADVPKAIPDNNPAGVTSNLVISGVAFVSDVDVRVGSLTHSFVGDLVIDLISPSGMEVRLFNRHGSSGDNLTNTVFDDAAATAITAGAAPFTGSFRPFEPLSAFNGQRANGTWKLRVADVASADTGTLNNWASSRRVYVCG